MAQHPKPTTFKSEKYKTFIRSIPCCVCDHPSEPHHVGLGESGMGKKAPDTHCVPLCRLHHAEHDQFGKDTFWDRHNIDVKKLIIGYLTRYIAEER